MKEVVIDSYKKRWAIKLKLKMFLLKTKTGISNTGKQIHPNLKGNHALGRTIQETDLKYLYEQKLQTGSSNHVQDKNKKNGSKACNHSKGITCWLGFCCWLWNLVTQVAFTTVN